MSSNQQSATIHTLHNDVLLHIFEFNGDMFTDCDALRTARMTTQVCRPWRYLMLETPSLWAKLVDMDEIYLLRNQKWQNELIQRGGDAPLWIRAENIQDDNIYNKDHPCYDDVEWFFDRLVTDNWHRIERLVLSHKSVFKLCHFTLSFPAPLLVHIEGAVPEPPYNSVKNGLILANYAPNLRHIYLGRDFVDPKAPWLCRLHSMKIDKTYSLLDALATLSATFVLQKLEIQEISAASPNTFLPTISLSHLQHLVYRINDSKAGITLLDRLTIPDGCSFDIYFENFNNKRRKYRKEFIFATVDKFMQHVERSLQSHVLAAVDLHYRENNNISWTFKTASSVSRSYSTTLLLSGDSDGSILDSFLTKLLQMHWRSPTYLIISAHGQLASTFGSLFSHLASVDTISSDFQTLSHLLDVHNSDNSELMDKPSIVFPLLKTVELFDHYVDPEEAYLVDQAIGAFLLSRSQAGIPITTLDMSQCELVDTPHDFGEVHNLNVLYRSSGVERILEFTYGGGEKNALT